jgi:hypothetical protein
MATATRIYHINVEGVVYLVRASTSAAALAHVTRRIASVRVASQDDLVNCLADGVKVDSAKEEAAPEPAPAPSMPLWPMPTPASSGFADMPTPQAEDDDEDENEEAPSTKPARLGTVAKYRDSMTGSTWSGRGLKPTWLRVALANGHQLAEFEVKAEEVQAS